MTSKQYFKNLQIIFFALLFGQIWFAVCAYFINFYADGFDNSDASFTQILQIIAVVLAVSSLLISTQVSKAFINKAKGEKTLKKKLESYRSASIIKYALLEGPSLISSTFLLLTGDLFFFIISLLIIAIFFIHKPSKEKTIADLGLHYTEQDLLKDENAIVA
ncbi:MAG: hypothetical protein ACPGVB_10320 [Chitinophagales bacterium]